MARTTSDQPYTLVPHSVQESSGVGTVYRPTGPMVMSEAVASAVPQNCRLCKIIRKIFHNDLLSCALNLDLSMKLSVLGQSVKRLRALILATKCGLRLVSV